MRRGERSQIRRMVLACRHLLEEEYDQLLRLRGLLPDRQVPAPTNRQASRAFLDLALEREGLDYPDARRRYIRQAAFTFLNRLLALQLAEAHGLTHQTVVARPEYGDRSRRERDLADADPLLATRPEQLAQVALKRAFAELGDTIPFLFREDDPYGLLLPRLPAYRQVRDQLAQVPEHLYLEFETLGWAYQYFNSEERKEIRRRLRRNPRPDDIPPLNQFYTVDWIVKALVHNTLGRLWLEAHPRSSLRDKLDYLVPVRTDFGPVERELSVEDLKVLDPACGSGHFLLGAFDLLLQMWHEHRPDLPRWRIPALILERNLFGVDIDLRACQIAAAALYLKARVTFERLKEGQPEARFEPGRINIVCADIRFLDTRRRERFLDQFSTDRALQRIVEQSLDACEHAYSIGGLLRLRQPFEKLFARRMAEAEELRLRHPQLRLFTVEGAQLSLGDTVVPVPRRLTVEDVVTGIGQFVRSATKAQDMGSRFFGMDAKQAVHLVDMLSEQYDVVLMNPPYGAMPSVCKEYARKLYPRTHRDYYTAFIEQAIQLCRPRGYVGALTGRTFLFLKSHQKLREQILRQEALPEVVWDLGFNVLDEATARYAASTIRKRPADGGPHWKEHSVTFFRLTAWDWEEKASVFEKALLTHHTRA